MQVNKFDNDFMTCWQADATYWIGRQMVIAIVLSTNLHRCLVLGDDEVVRTQGAHCLSTLALTGGQHCDHTPHGLRDLHRLSQIYPVLQHLPD